MPTKTNFYLNGTLVNPPKNWQELQLEVNFDREKFTSTQSVSVNEWEFVRENADTINGWVDGGLTGDVGIFEAIPLKIEIERNGVIEKPFDGYLDLPSGTYSCNRITNSAVERQQIDWLNDVADSFTFEYLFREVGSITKNDFVFQPYVISSVPDYKSSAIALLSAFIMEQELKRSIQKFKELSASATNVFEATVIIRTIFYILYVITLILALIKLIKDTITFLIQPVKYHAGMSVKTQLEKGAEHLGMKFDSTILNSPEFENLTIIPEKYFNPVNKTDTRILGFTIPNKNRQEGFFKGTFGDLLRAMKTMFKAKVVIDGGTIYLIRKDQNIKAPQYSLPDVRQLYHTYNASEMQSNYLVSFLTDVTEANTIQEYEGTSYQVITRPIKINNSDLVLTRNLQEERIPFALAKRKTELTIVEQIIKLASQLFDILLGVVRVVLNALISVINAVIKVINAVTKALKVVGIKVKWQIKPIPKLPKYSLAGAIENRIGMLMLESDYFNSPKIYLLTKGSQDKFNKISLQNSSTINAKYLWNNFHYIDSFVPTTDRPNANQYIIKEFEKVPFCFEDYEKVKANNSIFVNGLNAEIETLKWNVYEQHADMRVRISQLYTNNLKLITLEPSGI